MPSSSFNLSELDGRNGFIINNPASYPLNTAIFPIVPTFFSFFPTNKKPLTLTPGASCLKMRTLGFVGLMLPQKFS
jgi:hypothetical protein